MPVICAPSIVEKQGKVYRGKKRSDEEEDRRAISELQSILNSRNRKVCDCEAQVHDLLENCLSCGRLTCVAEGPGKCFHCASVVLSQEQRERFKKHIETAQSSMATSRQQAQRSARIKIVDNQFDEFSIENKRHLREGEKKKLKDSLSELQSKRYQRKMVLDVDLANLEAQAVSAPVIEDYTSEMRKLQIGNETLGEGSSSCGKAGLASKKTLAEVMEQQARDIKASDEGRTKGKFDRKKVNLNKNQQSLGKPDSPYKQDKSKETGSDEAKARRLTNHKRGRENSSTHH